MTKPILKNFNFISTTMAYDSYRWSCPDLNGYYEVTIHNAFCSPNDNMMIPMLNSPQIVTASMKNSTVGNIVNYNGNNFNISTANYVYLGLKNQNQLKLQNMKIIMRLSGTFHQEFLSADLLSGTNNLFRQAYTQYSLVASFLPYTPSLGYRIGVNPIAHKPDRKMITIYNQAETSFISREVGLYGKYKVTPVVSYYSGDWPENVGIALYSSQISTTITNDKRIYLQSCDQSSQRGQVFNPYPELVGEFCGYIDFTIYSVQNYGNIESVRNLFLQLMCEKV